MHKARTVSVVTSTEAQNKFGEMLRRTYANAEHVIVEKGGIPVAALIPVADYQEHFHGATSSTEIEDRLVNASRREQASRQLSEILERVHAHMPDIDEEEVDRDIAEAIQAVRRAPAKRKHATAKPTRVVRTRRPAHRKA